MSKIIVTLLILVTFLQSYAQIPNKMSYQAVVRNSSDALVTNQNIGLRISIIKGSVFGASVYVETHTSLSNQNGLVSIEIGSGNAILGSFSNIDWSSGLYFVKNEIDLNGGNNYTISSISQLMSVPYALYAATAGNNLPGPEGAPGKTIHSGKIDPTAQIGKEGDFYLNLSTNVLFGPRTKIADSATGFWSIGTPLVGPKGDQGPIGPVGPAGTSTALLNGLTDPSPSTGMNGDFYINTTSNVMFGPKSNGIWPTGVSLVGPQGPTGTTPYTIGQFAHGGIVFWVDASGQHGLVCAKKDQSSGIRWNAGSNSNTMAKGDGIKSGQMNTILIISNQGNGDGGTYAARICNELEITESGITYGDWYLPSVKELELIYPIQSIINSAATANGGTPIKREAYWTSSEFDSNTAMYFSYYYISGGMTYNVDKSESHPVRAIRAF